jgi:hypothetical protein
VWSVSEADPHDAFKRSQFSRLKKCLRVENGSPLKRGRGYETRIGLLFPLVEVSAKVSAPSYNLLGIVVSDYR